MIQCEPEQTPNIRKSGSTFMCVYHYTKIIFVRLCIYPSVSLSVTEGQRKRFDPKTEDTVSWPLTIRS